MGDEKMTAQAIYTLWLRDLKWFIRAKARVISSIATPFLWLAIIGVGLSATFPKVQFSGSELSPLEFIAPGIVGMTLLFSSTMFGLSVIWDKQFGFMKEILVAPVSRIHIMLGKVFGGSTVSMLQGILILFAVGLVGIRPSSLVGLLQALAFMVLISLSFVSIGLAFASRINDPIAFPIVVNFLIMPLFFLSGTFYLIGSPGLPSWLGFLTRLNPLAYGVDGLRGAVLGTSHFPILLDFAVLAVFSLAMILLGGYLFRKISA